MSIPPIDAESALAEVRARREQVVSSNLVPNWFWAAVSALMLLFVAAIESRVGWLIAVGAVAYTLGLGVLILAVVRNARVQVRQDLLGPRGVATILAFALVLVVAGVGFGFALEALGVPFPATVAIVPVAVAMTFGGPRLMAHLRRLMLSRPLAGS